MKINIGKKLKISTNYHKKCPSCKNHKKLGRLQFPEFDGNLTGESIIYCNSCESFFTEKEVEEYNQSRKRQYGITINIGDKALSYCFN